MHRWFVHCVFFFFFILFLFVAFFLKTFLSLFFYINRCSLNLRADLSLKTTHFKAKLSKEYCVHFTLQTLLIKKIHDFNLSLRWRINDCLICFRFLYFYWDQLYSKRIRWLVGFNPLSISYRSYLPVITSYITLDIFYFELYDLQEIIFLFEYWFSVFKKFKLSLFRAEIRQFH